MPTVQKGHCPLIFPKDALFFTKMQGEKSGATSDLKDFSLLERFDTL